MKLKASTDLEGYRTKDSQPLLAFAALDQAESRSRAAAILSQHAVSKNMSINLSRSQDRTAVDLALLVVRVVAGVILAAHGAQKLFGAFGGTGLAATVENLGLIGYPVAVGEFFGGIGLIVGFLSRFSAASNIVIMLGAIAMVHGKNGFFLSAGGCEYNIALIGLLLPTLIAGPGKFAVGRLLPLPKAAGTTQPISILE